MERLKTLYLKTHNNTQLKYLGKTVQDPFKYSGSGVKWKDHLKKYGDDVTTKILFETTDDDEFERVGLEYSEKWNIVESEEFANLIPEDGRGPELFGESNGRYKDGRWSDPEYAKKYHSENRQKWDRNYREIHREERLRKKRDKYQENIESEREKARIRMRKLREKC